MKRGMAVAWVLVGLFGLGGCGPGGGPQLRFLDYLRADHYARLVIEVDAAEGYAPRDSSAHALVEGLAPLVDKPMGVEAILDETLPSKGPDHGWTYGELQSLAGRTFDLKVPRDAVKMHILFVDGHDAEDGPGDLTLGYAWGYTSAVVFAETLANACANEPAEIREEVCAASELWVWTHETGHLLGLVDLGVPMVHDHEDPDHPGHDVNPNCVMYWAWQSTRVVRTVSMRIRAGGTSTIGFDANCQADLAAVRNGHPGS